MLIDTGIQAQRTYHIGGKLAVRPNDPKACVLSYCAVLPFHFNQSVDLLNAYCVPLPTKIFSSSFSSQLLENRGK